MKAADALVKKLSAFPDIVSISYTLGVLLIGSVSLLYLFVTERLPDQTPHQSMRAGRIAFTSPLLWLLISVHIASGLLAGVGALGK